MRKTLIAASCVALAGVGMMGTAAQAGDAGHAAYIAVRIFTAVDADKDGAMSRDEYAKGGLGKFGASFDDFDLDKDDSVSQAEYMKVFTAFHSGPRPDEA